LSLLCFVIQVHLKYPEMPVNLKKIQSRLSNIYSKPINASGSGETRGEAKWKEISDATNNLLQEMEKMYWNGVGRELIDIILTLKTWQQPEFADVEPEDEKDDEIYGFDTFLDQVNASSRAMAELYGKLEQLRSLKPQLKMLTFP
jgi:hypothetical protein